MSELVFVICSETHEHNIKLDKAGILALTAGLCSSRAQGPQATHFCLRVTRKKQFFV